MIGFLSSLKYEPSITIQWTCKELTDKMFTIYELSNYPSPSRIFLLNPSKGPTELFSEKSTLMLGSPM